MKRYDRRPRWKAAILRAGGLPATTKLVLLVLLDHMQADGKVQYRVRDVADDLGYRNPRRITDRISEAHRLGYLITVSKAVHGRVAVYQATFPSDLETGSLETEFQVPANGVTGNGVTRRADARNGVTSITAQTPDGTDRNADTDSLDALTSVAAPVRDARSNEEQHETTRRNLREAS